MGTDITIVVEKKTPNGWVAVNALAGCWCSIDYKEEKLVDWVAPAALDRNYARFGALAGVRCDGPEPRGFPKDASDTSCLLWAERGGHTPSWMPLEEAAQIFLKTDAEFVRHLVRDPKEFYFDVVEEKQELHRVIFWFDD